MATKKKAPLTHCEKYGHTWVSSTSDGFEVCSHINYVNNKPVPCRAARRLAEATPRKSLRRSSSVSLRQPLAQPVPLWES